MKTKIFIFQMNPLIAIIPSEAIAVVILNAALQLKDA